MKLEKILWPALDIDRAAPLRSVLAHLEKTQWLDPSEIENGQHQQLRLLVAHHGMCSPFFRSQLEDMALDPGGESLSLAGLPVLRRRDLQTARESFFASEVPAHHGPASLTQTSGSTGEPVRVYRTTINSLFWQAYNIRDHLWFGRNFSSKLSSVRANISQYVEVDSWGMPAASIYKTGPGQGIPITLDIGKQLELIRKFDPAVLIVYPSNLGAFLGIWETSGFDLHSLKHLKTIGETVSESLRSRVRSVTGLAIEDQYSSNEFGTMAIQCPVSGGYHVMSESVIVEILDSDNRPCKEGAVGRIVVTDLHNFLSPLIRYEVGDYGLADGACACGRGLPLIRNILGRERNLVIKPDGTRHWPLIGFDAFNTVAPVEQYQFVQHSRTNLEFRVLARGGLTPEQKQQLTGIAQKALDHPFSIDIVEFDDRLPTGANGKFEEFICLCD